MFHKDEVWPIPKILINSQGLKMTQKGDINVLWVRELAFTSYFITNVLLEPRGYRILKLYSKGIMN